MRFSCLFGVFLVFGLNSASLAQGVCGDCAERYVEMAESRGLQADIDYLSPGDPLELDRTKRSRKKADDAGESDFTGPDQIGWLLISGLILAGIAFVVYQNSAGGLVSFARRPDDAATPNTKNAGSRSRPGDDDGLPKSEAAFLAEIEGMADRRKALYLLSERLLSRAADKAGIRLGRSWTARESLRALPRSLAHLPDLRHLNRHAERAWFGGRPVDDHIFQDCLERAKMMMRGGSLR